MMQVESQSRLILESTDTADPSPAAGLADNAASVLSQNSMIGVLDAGLHSSNGDSAQALSQVPTSRHHQGQSTHVNQLSGGTAVRSTNPKGMSVEETARTASHEMEVEGSALQEATTIGTETGGSLDADTIAGGAPIAAPPLLQYRPKIDIPPFHGSSSLRFGGRPLSKYQLPLNHWPQYRQFHQQKLNEAAKLPPKIAPFHEQVQTYVQTWFTWAHTIPDVKRRASVIEWIGERMETAWKYGIDNGLYPGSDDPSTQRVGTSGLSASQIVAQIMNPESTKSGEKRKKKKVEPDDSWLFPDGISWCSYSKVLRDKGGRVMLKEIIDAGVSTRAISARVSEKDFQEGEELFDSTIRNLDRDIMRQDWKLINPDNTYGRDLLMYALHEVQITRMEIINLQRLFRGFNRSAAKTNTMARIDEQQYRQYQFLALAIEINHKRPKEVDEDEMQDEDENAEHSDRDVTNVDDSEREESQASDEANTVACAEKGPASQLSREDTPDGELTALVEPQCLPTSEEAAVIDLAKEVLAQPYKTGMAQAFESRGLTESALSMAIRTTAQEDTSVSKMRIILLTMLRNVNKTMALGQKIQTLGPHDDRNELDTKLADIRTRMTSDKMMLSNELENITAKTAPPTKTSAEKVAVPQLEKRTNNGDNMDAESYNVMQDQGIDVKQLSSDLSPFGDFATPRSTTPEDQTSSGVDPSEKSTKRGLEDLEDGHDMPDAKQRKLSDVQAESTALLKPHLDQETQPFQGQPNAFHAASMRPSSPTSSTSIRGSPATVNKFKEYCQSVFVPILNEVLRPLRIEEVGLGVHRWVVIREHLKANGFNLQVRNQWYRKLINGYEAASNPPSEVTFPEGHEVIEAIPEHGIPQIRLIELFQARIGARSDDFSDLVDSVAWSDSLTGLVFKKNGDFSDPFQASTAPTNVANNEYESEDDSYIAPGQRRQTLLMKEQPGLTQHGQTTSPRRMSQRKASPLRPSKIICLRLRPGFDPADNLWDTNIKTFKGFNFRFTPISTRNERSAIHDEVRAWVKERASGKAMAGTFHPRPRFGSYEAFGALGGKIVAHGFWNDKDGNQPNDSEWFWANDFTMNEDGEIIRNDGGVVGTMREAKKVKPAKKEKLKEVPAPDGLEKGGQPRRQRKGPESYADGDDNGSDSDYRDA